MVRFEPGSIARMYFTMTAFAIDGKNTWQVARSDMEQFIPGGAA